MSISQAVRYVAPTKSALGGLYINCQVKPNARQGSELLSVKDNVVELAVSTQAREGEANKAVVGLLAGILKVAKSDVEVVRGMKSREKTIKIDAASLSGTAEKGKSKEKTADLGSAMIGRVQALLQREVDRK